MLRFFRSRNPSEEEVFNIALKLSLVWGKHWMEPIQERLLKRFPTMERSEANRLNELCRAIQNYCWENLCYKELDGQLTRDEVHARLIGKYPDVSRSNAHSLICQGMYYVRK